MKHIKSSFLLIVIGILLCLVGCAENQTSQKAEFLSESELENCALYIHNVTCSEVYETRTASDTDYLKQIAKLSVTAQQFRPAISTDLVLGQQLDAYYVFDNGKVRYTFTFFETEKQLDIGFVHRENPIIIVSKATAADGAQFHEDWDWMCTLTAANYAALYESIQTYTDGEIVS